MKSAHVICQTSPFHSTFRTESSVLPIKIRFEQHVYRSLTRVPLKIFPPNPLSFSSHQMQTIKIKVPILFTQIIYLLSSFDLQLTRQTWNSAGIVPERNHVFWKNETTYLRASSSRRIKKNTKIARQFFFCGNSRVTTP